MDLDVALVRWPDDEPKRQDMAGRGKARLLLVMQGEEPPLCLDQLEDWVRLPASTDEIRARALALIGRIHTATRTVPTLENGGTLRYLSSRIELPPLQGRLLGALIDKYEAVVSRENLMLSGWPERQPGPNTLDVHMGRLRRRLDPHGLEIRTVRSRGYLLTTAPTVDPS